VPSGPIAPPAIVLGGPWFEPPAGTLVRWCSGGGCETPAPPTTDEPDLVVQGLGRAGLSAELEDGRPIASWTARVTDADGATHVLARGGAEPFGSAYFPGPDPGRWDLSVHMAFPDGSEAGWSWPVRVRLPARPSPSGDVGPPDVAVASGGESVTALEGAHCYDGTCADVPFHATARTSPLLRVAAGERVRFVLAYDAMERWTASVWPARDDEAVAMRTLATGDGGRAMELPALPRDHQVLLSVRFPSDGDATYYVHLVVD
jgi:hypothetical protein